ncbi:hypothetical protein OE88DRAFT_1668042 [Heliocybe sulcata]|uniref:Uncharacterized protein n=1 Tax=Heliocybe sulcata TaxID=5364 RepID=A0A5C3MN68_9AGAM|nr:hypothetical protein OE88DRAFT_1668042 [Heliocybe sulcata]
MRNPNNHLAPDHGVRPRLLLPLSKPAFLPGVLLELNGNNYLDPSLTVSTESFWSACSM